MLFGHINIYALMGVSDDIYLFVMYYGSVERLSFVDMFDLTYDL